MSIFENRILNTKIKNYLHGEIENPILKKVIEEEFIYSDNIESIIQTYFSELIKSEKYDENLNYLSVLIKNVSKDNYNFLREIICTSFIKLNPDEQIFIIINMNDNNKNMFEMINDDKNTQQLLKYLLSGLSIGINDQYIIKCVESCKIINKSIANLMVMEYINNNTLDIVSNNKLLAYFIKHMHEENYNNDNLKPLIIIKFESIQSNLNMLSLNNMEFAFEIYNIGKLLIESNISNNKHYSYYPEMKFTNEQLEYIIKSIHTCIINKNIPQAQAILAIIYIMDNIQKKKFIDYYNKFLLLRIQSINMDDILSTEYNLWNINNQYNIIMNLSSLVEYKRIINNIKYSSIINNDLDKIKIKNSTIEMNKLKIKLENEIDVNFQEMKHHPDILQYITNLNKYFEVRTPLQTIKHSMDKSKITFKTNMGTITCSLMTGSILLYLKDQSLTISELVNKTNISESEIRNKIDTLCMNDIVVCNEDGITYKYIEPFGDVDCFHNNWSNFKIKLEKDMVMNKFTDIIMTTESRIIKEVKICKMNIMELERRVQEYMGESYLRNIFYQRVESLKKRFLIDETDSIVEYQV